MKSHSQATRTIGRGSPWPLLCIAGLLAMSSVPSWAQSTASAVTDKEVIIDQLLKRIESLEANQKAMQDKLAATQTQTGSVSAAATVPAQEPLTKPAVAEGPVATPASSLAEDASVDSDSDSGHKLGPVQFRGYSDVNYGRALFEKMPNANQVDGGLKGSPNSMNIGDFDLFVNSRISNHWSVLGELLITSDFSNEFGAEMDRLMLTYRKNDYFNVSIGKFNTALGYYPNAFHRARYFQTATGRPLMWADEDNGGILPLHSVGISMTGKIPSETWGLHWVAELVNGRPANSEAVPVQNFVDENNGKGFDFGIYARPERLSGFQTGLSFYRDTLHPAFLGTSIGQTIITGHAVYVTSKMEWLNEASLVRNEQQATGFVNRSTTMYTQLSRSFGKNTPFARFDYQNVPTSDPLFGMFGRRSGPSIGLNRRLADYVVFKLQYGLLQSRGNDSINDLQAQLAFAF
jgi:hypothetical protein